MNKLFFTLIVLLFILTQAKSRFLFDAESSEIEKEESGISIENTTVCDCEKLIAQCPSTEIKKNVISNIAKKYLNKQKSNVNKISNTKAKSNKNSKPPTKNVHRDQKITNSNSGEEEVDNLENIQEDDLHDSHVKNTTKNFSNLIEEQWTDINYELYNFGVEIIGQLGGLDISEKNSTFQCILEEANSKIKSINLDEFLEQCKNKPIQKITDKIDELTDMVAVDFQCQNNENNEGVFCRDDSEDENNIREKREKKENLKENSSRKMENLKKCLQEKSEEVMNVTFEKLQNSVGPCIDKAKKSEEIIPEITESLFDNHLRHRSISTGPFSFWH